jgi:heptosyltransferase III
MDFKKILIFRIGHLGDTLVTLPAFRSVREAFPGAELTFLSNSNPQRPHYVAARNVLPEKGLFDQWLTYPADGDKIRMLQNSLKLLIDLRRRKFDAVIYLMTRNRTAGQLRRDRLFFRLAGIKKIIGIDSVERGRLDFAHPRPLPRVVPEGRFFLDALAAENVPLPPTARADLLITAEESAKAREWLEQHCGKDFETKKLIGVAPASKWESKVWAEERFEKVVAELIARKNVFPVVFGGNEEREKGRRLLARWGTGANAAGALDIRQAAAALAHCRLFLGNDTGTMHLAAAVGTPCVGIFAAIDWPGRWEPWGGPMHTVFRAEVECEGCHLSVCPRKNKCLDLIGPEAVLEVCLQKLENV